MAEIINHIYQFKRGTAQRWVDINPVLRQGEPGFEYDTGRLKIGDGFSPWLSLKYINYEHTGEQDGIITINTYEELPREGNPELIYRVVHDSVLYQWNAQLKIYEILGSAEEINTEEVKNLISELAIAKTFEIDNVPNGTLVKYTDNEIRVMCPANTEWTVQNISKNNNLYYMHLKTYAPTGAISFRHGERGSALSEMLEFSEEHGGKDELERKYSIYELALANYNDETGVWSYYGKNSNTKKYIGWNYMIEWYDTNGLKIGSNHIRINLSNESCHNFAEPYYMGSINLNRIVQSEGDTMILYGGSATENIGGIVND